MRLHAAYCIGAYGELIADNSQLEFTTETPAEASVPAALCGKEMAP